MPEATTETGRAAVVGDAAAAAAAAAAGTSGTTTTPADDPAKTAADAAAKTAADAAAATADAKAKADADAAAAAAKVPDKYDLKLPENSLLDATALERTAATARELGLSQEAAQKALEFVNSEVAAREAAFLEAHKPGGAAWAEQEKAWHDAALADKELGGSPEKLAATAESGKRVLAKYGSDDLIQFLNDTGFGSHPAVLRFTSKLGAAMSEGALALPGSQASGERSAAEVLYGSTTGSST